MEIQEILMQTFSKLEVRKIKKEDVPQVAALIRSVMTEFGATGCGFAIHDSEVNDMFSAYDRKGSAYFVVTDGEKILGGGGVAPLVGSDGKTCEIRKMYFYPSVRGLGKGKEVMELCLKTAKDLKYKKCYLETLKKMHQAKALYRKYGFKELKKPSGNTGHFSCDSWFEKEL